MKKNNLDMYCLSLYPNNLGIIKAIGYLPVGVGDNKFSKNWLSDKFKNDISIVGINSNDSVKYPDDDFESMKAVAKEKGLEIDYLVDETQEIAKKYGAVCTPDFFGYNKNLELQYRGRLRELRNLIPVKEGESDLLKAMKQIAKTGEGPKDQIPSAGCSIKWKTN